MSCGKEGKRRERRRVRDGEGNMHLAGGPGSKSPMTSDITPLPCLFNDYLSTGEAIWCCPEEGSKKSRRKTLY